jgi:hypothetical protein
VSIPEEPEAESRNGESDEDHGYGNTSFEARLLSYRNRGMSRGCGGEGGGGAAGVGCLGGR